uniref:Reverse transcriptase domain-containing protein n=1 Tax=Tanacetum cinerariifolium TaxID=118510 RepID=A0A6L2JB53_TANCI|nr:hypothetical protein [Tanacetum cinerariifolium]
MHDKEFHKELISPFENPERVFHSKKRLFEIHGLVESSSPEPDLFSDIKEHSKEETTEIMTETIEKYMSKTRGNYGSRVARPKINDKTHFELKGQFLKELQENTFRGSEHEDANERIKEVFEIVDLIHIPEEVILFYNGLDVPTRQILDSKGVIPTKAAVDAKILLYKPSSTTSGEKLRKSTRKYMLLRGQYRAAGPGFYQRNNGNSSHPDRRQTLEESLTKFIAASAKRHEENSNIIKEIRASTDAAIRNQGASIKTLEIQISQMSKVLQERGIEGLPGSTKPNPKDHVKSISTAKANSSAIRRIGSDAYDISNAQYNSLSSKMVSFPTLVDLGASVSVMPFSTYSNLGLGFVILEIPKDDDVPLILERPFLSTAHAKIDVFKRNFTLRVGEEKLVYKSIKPTTIIIRRVYMLKERTDLDSKTKFVEEAINESFDPLYGKNQAGTSIDIPIFVGNFSIISGFSITDDVDITSGVVLGM